MSGVGKGVAASSLGKILQTYGFKVSAIKIDPYLNIDAGTMNPIEHGEVFVTEDGAETDQDLGNYERFLDQNMYNFNYMTTGQIYQSVLEKERKLQYGGKCVEVVPHITEEIISRIKRAGARTKADFVLVEIGGTVGEYQNLIFLEAARMMHLKMPGKVLFIMVSYLPVPKMVGEMKTKPTQHAVRSLNAIGIQPDIIIGRSEVNIDEPRKEKIAIFCNVDKEDVISAPDEDNIYQIPVNLEKAGLGRRVLSKMEVKPKKKKFDLGPWMQIVKKMKNNLKPVKIAIVGKYFVTGNFSLTDSYISVIEAVKHASWQMNRSPKIQWLDAEEYEKNPKKLKELKKFDGIIIPGGFGNRAVEGKIKVIKFARENKIPFFGLCLGMQLAVIELARSLAKLKKANSSEFDPDCEFPVISTMEEQEAKIKDRKMGGTMRLGGQSCELLPGSISRRAYGEKLVSERHRHRYEFNNFYKDVLEKNGIRFAGINREKNLVEIIELKNHPFFVGVQFHPEFKSRPLSPHPLFVEFIKSAIKKSA